MFISPSTVLFTTCPGAPGLEWLSNAEFEELSKKFFANSEGLRLQVVEKDGHYFTLNNTRLQVCQWLENKGHCTTVRIEAVPLKSVPEGIKRMMIVPNNSTQSQASEQILSITYEPMERRPRTANDDNEDQSGSDDTDAEDLVSFCDAFEDRDQQSKRRRQSEESGEEEDTSLLRPNESSSEGDKAMYSSSKI